MARSLGVREKARAVAQTEKVKIMASILVIDDDVSMTAIISSILKEAGYDVYTAPDFQEGLSSVKVIRPHMIILDMHLQQEDGGALLEKIRAIPRFEHTPVLMLSGETKLAEIRSKKKRQ